jgi:hypothetical protein
VEVAFPLVLSGTSAVVLVSSVFVEVMTTSFIMVEVDSCRAIELAMAAVETSKVVGAGSASTMDEVVS